MRQLSFTLGSSDSTIVFCSAESAVSKDRREAVYVTDSIIHRIYSGLLPDPEAQGLAVEVLPPGEKSKDWPQVEAILNAGFRIGMGRDGQFIGMGGGVLTDLTGFAASVYMRGCDLVLVPTTLLAMVDAAFGGKTGINFGGYKNMVGTFYPAREVRISTDFVRTLPEREYSSGLAEVIKSAALGDDNLLDILEKHQTDVQNRVDSVVQEIVFRSIAVKGRIVETDLLENNVRAYLNLGHSFAHALESVVGLGDWSHGEAVAWGMVQAMDLGLRLGITREDYAKRLVRLIKSYGFRTQADVDAESLLHAMRMDKKKKAGKLRFVLQAGLCDSVLREVEDKAVLDLLKNPGLALD